MSTTECQTHPPKCARESCNNTTSRYTKPKNGVIWKKYCCPACQVPGQKGTSKYTHPESAPMCGNSLCNNTTKRRSRKNQGWNKFCSTRCQNIFKGPPELSKESITKISKSISNVWQNRLPETRDEIFQKSKKNRFSSKEFTYPSGRTIQVMGNEGLALTNLLLSYKEEDILAGSDLLLAISYLKPNGRKARYYPDIYIPKENLIVEVKSNWTYNGRSEWLESNLLKQKACLDAGYNFKFLIF